MNNHKNLTSHDYDPMVYADSCCGPEGCEPIKWSCDPQCCYPILAQKVFSCTDIKGAAIQSNLLECTFVTDIPKSAEKVECKEVCILGVECIKFKCVGLGVDKITEKINFEDLEFESSKKPCVGPPPNGNPIYTKYTLETYVPDVSINDLCYKERCGETGGIRLHTSFATDDYRVYGLEIKVRARFKDAPPGRGEFTATAIIEDPNNLGQDPKDTNFPLSNLGFSTVNFYGDICVPAHTPCDIYKVFGGNFKFKCVDTELLEKPPVDTCKTYTFDAKYLLWFCPTEKIYSITEELMGVNSTLNPNVCHIPVSPCHDGCHSIHHD